MREETYLVDLIAIELLNSKGEGLLEVMKWRCVEDMNIRRRKGCDLRQVLV